MKIILASQSPRRIALLKSLNLQFDTIPSTLEESYDVSDSPDIVVMSLAFEKAYEIAKEHPDAIVIAFDTVVYKDTILGKPKDEDDAYRMLSLLNGSSHTVLTGLAILQLSRQIKVTEVVNTRVTFRQLEDDVLKRYIATKEPLDKAGAYGIQGFGALLIDHIDGDYYAVMGLPLSTLDQFLKQYFKIQIL